MSLPEISANVAEQRLSEEQLKMITGLEIQSLVGPDGETVLITDAADIVKYTGIDEETILLFDFAYIRYSRPYFYAGMYIADEEREPLPEMKWFKVRKGDLLDCGLTVKRAEFNMKPSSNWERLTYLQTIELDGEITLEGMLFATTNPNDYSSKVGDLNFIVDPNQTDNIPVVRLNHDNNDIWNNLNRIMFPEHDPEYIESDVRNTWYIGNIDDSNFDQSTIFDSDEFVRVKATLKNIKLDVFNELGGGGIGGEKVTAEIVEIERID